MDTSIVITVGAFVENREKLSYITKKRCHNFLLFPPFFFPYSNAGDNWIQQIEIRLMLTKDKSLKGKSISKETGNRQKKKHIKTSLLR